MLRHLPLILVTALAAIVITLHFSQPYDSTPVVISETTTPAPEKPDFTAYKSVSKRKAAFFGFLKPYVKERNQEILALRKRIESGQIKGDELTALAKRYRIKSKDPAIIQEQLLIKVDALPASLVLAQGAMESAWGTSRFARDGNNYFGQWCFTSGCGLVPESRGEGKKHEVRVFESPMDSVISYMRNLNSHPAYRDLRATRSTLRQQGDSYNGCYLAGGLTHYSEKGDAYVESLKTLIRANKLEQDPHNYCAAVMIAEEKSPPARSTELPLPADAKGHSINQPGEEKPAPSSKNKTNDTDIATDDSQSALPPTDKVTHPSS
ncbi:glucosaminidase domain-containing protein [Ketobacter sp.]